MKIKINISGFINFKLIILILLAAYIIWLVNLFYNTVTEIDQMYNDSYDKRVDEKNKISEIIRVKNNQSVGDNENYDEYKVSIDTILNK